MPPALPPRYTALRALPAGTRCACACLAFTWLALRLVAAAKEKPQPAPQWAVDAARVPTPSLANTAPAVILSDDYLITVVLHNETEYVQRVVEIPPPKRPSSVSSNPPSSTPNAAPPSSKNK